jgi:hypothetical protein
MSAKHDKGVTWFKAVAKLMLIITAVRLLFAFSHHDVPFQLFQVFIQLLIGVVIFGGGAYVLGWITIKDEASIPDPATQLSATSSQHPAARSQHTLTSNITPAINPPTTQHAMGSQLITNTHAVDEDAIYAIVAEEIETGTTDKGLWTRLYAEFDGDEKKTKIAYIKQRAIHLAGVKSLNTNTPSQHTVEPVCTTKDDYENKKNTSWGVPFFWGLNLATAITCIIVWIYMSNRTY